MARSHVDLGGSSTFPVPPEIQQNVDFWRHVYGIWSRSQVVIHDAEHMGVIYEVSRIPGPVQASYTGSQQAWLDARTESYVTRLKDLEQRVRFGQTLTSDDKQLLAKFEQAGARGAVFGAAERVRSQRGLRERFRRGVEISGRYDDRFREIMRRHGVPEDLAYLPHVESSFQTNARSGVGAVGVWQFMPSTGRLYMTVNKTVDERFDPILAADGAGRYLAQAYNRLGSWPLAITSYNHGQAGMAKAKAEYGNDIGRIVTGYKGKYFGFASRNFYAEFLAAREVARHPDRYFPEGVRYESPWPHDRLILASSMPADHIADHYDTSPERLTSLNMHWRESVQSGDYLPAGTTVWLPQGSTRRVANQPPPVSMAIARAESAPTAKVKSTPKIARVDVPVVTAKPKMAGPAKGNTKTKAAVRPKSKEETRTAAADKKSTRFHVVKPQETLYRVAVQNGLSVAELRKLNKMRPDDNHIQAGQKLKVGI